MRTQHSAQVLVGVSKLRKLTMPNTRDDGF